MGKIFKSLVVLTSKFVMVAVVDSNHLVSTYVVATSYWHTTSYFGRGQPPRPPRLAPNTWLPSAIEHRRTALVCCL